MRVRRQETCPWAVVLFAWASAGYAQTAVTPEDQYKKLIRVREDIPPLGEHPFGEQVSLYGGSLAGNDPQLQLSRSFRPVDKKESAKVDDGFAAWKSKAQGATP